MSDDRIARQMWVDGDFANKTATGTEPAKPSIYETAYTYDGTDSTHT
ncbi:MAG: hypothetical protein KC983_06930 [Phycisphaerales bacterium]|nr:hypothetical protein [Phycisphaerales bacterium]